MMMSQNKKLSIAFYWHMHQPVYQLTPQGDYLMPWVRMHAVKDYLDMVLVVNKFKKLNFEFASEQIMSIAVNEILQKDNPGSLDRQEYFSQAFTNIYARVEKLPESENRNEMLKRLNQRVFAPANGIQKPMSYYMLERMQAFAVEKNVAGLQKVLQNCAELKNSAKTHSSMIKDVNMR